MTNEFLKNLGIDEEIIKQIQAEAGRDISAAKTKLQQQIDSLTSNVTDLQNQIADRDTNIETIKQQLTEAQGSKTKFNELQQTLTDLQNQYANDKTSWENKLNKQQYEFLAKETINSIKFSSNAAKDNFYQKLLEKNLPVENQKLLGFDDYLATVKESDPGAFVIEPEPNPEPNPEPKPQFINPNNPQPNNDPKPNMFGWNFIGVRKHD